MSNQKKHNSIWTIVLIISIIFAAASVGFLVSGMISAAAQPEPTEPPTPTEPMRAEIMDAYDVIVADAITEAYEAAKEVKKVYWIDEDALVAPMPNPACYGETEDPTSLQWLLDEAAEILDGQDLVFHTGIEIAPLSKITYYLDESIFVITWLEVRANFVYTFSEVKVTHPSQFRRHLANNEYDSDYSHPVSRMGNMVNAVMAASADFYRGRNHGIIVYQGEVKRANYSDRVDTCFVDKNGNLILVPAGELITVEEAQAFVDEHEIDFSLAFGPILVKDGVRCDPKQYYLGEVTGKYPRAALCQMDQLHYVVVTANSQHSYRTFPTINNFADQIETIGAQSAYTLDGGQTGTIAMRGKALNPLQSSERWISDIIYWGTAIGYEEAEPTEP